MCPDDFSSFLRFSNRSTKRLQPDSEDVQTVVLSTRSGGLSVTDKSRGVMPLHEGAHAKIVDLRNHAATGYLDGAAQ
eukprot:766292-Hanusia_phi.AAC.1